MPEKAALRLFNLGNVLYKYCYPIYRPLYFLYKRINDRNKISELRKYVSPGMNVLDIGSNIGYYTILLSQLVGKYGHVHAFEPDPLNFFHLANNVSRFNNVSIYKMAVGDKSNRVNLYISSELNVDHHTYDSGENRKCISIRCIALDEFFGPEIEINFIKLDIQGFDLYAVQGAKNIINKQESMVIMGELWPYGLSKAGTTPKDYVGLLTQMGFQLKFYNDPESAGYFDGKVGEKEYYTGFIGIKKPNR